MTELRNCTDDWTPAQKIQISRESQMGAFYC